jgi:hypothetical protein
MPHPVGSLYKIEKLPQAWVTLPLMDRLTITIDYVTTSSDQEPCNGGRFIHYGNCPLPVTFDNLLLASATLTRATPIVAKGIPACGGTVNWPDRSSADNLTDYRSQGTLAI